MARASVSLGATQAQTTDVAQRVVGDDPHLAWAAEARAL